MNKVCLVGRITAKPELRKTNSNIEITKFTIAINRKPKEDGTKETDFVNCIAFKSTAETISKYFDKGSQIGIDGRIQTGSYEKDGKKVYTTDIIVEDITFLDNKKEVKESEQIEDIDPFAAFNESIKGDFLD